MLNQKSSHVKSMLNRSLYALSQSLRPTAPCAALKSEKSGVYAAFFRQWFRQGGSQNCCTIFLAFGKNHRNRRSFPHGAVHFDLGLVIGRPVFDNGKPQSGAADGAGVTLIHPIEALKNPLDLF